MTKKIFFTGGSSYCLLTDYSCRKIGVPIGSSFALSDPYRAVYQPCKTGARDYTGIRIDKYELICRDN